MVGAAKMPTQAYSQAEWHPLGAQREAGVGLALAVWKETKKESLGEEEAAVDAFPRGEKR